MCKFKHFFLGVGCDATRIRVGLNNNTSLDPFNLVESILSHGTYLESPHHSCHSFLSNMNSTFNVIYTYIYKNILCLCMQIDEYMVYKYVSYIYIYVRLISCVYGGFNVSIPSTLMTVKTSLKRSNLRFFPADFHLEGRFGCDPV